MNKEIQFNQGKVQHRIGTPAYQRGVLTTFTGVLILVLLTLMMFFAVRVGVFEQRVSSNDARQKLAFHAAESAIHQGKEYIRANKAVVAKDQEDFLPDGTDGWLAETAEKRWLKCSEAGLDLTNGSGDHPCFGESLPDQRANTYYYSFGGSTELFPAEDDTILDTNEILPGTSEAATVQALLCVLDIDSESAVPVQGCSQTTEAIEGGYYMVTLLARGGSDCTGSGANIECNAESLVSEQISNFGPGAGGNAPAVPLVTKSSFPPSGSAEVVPNPNAGGIGVPISVWMNGNDSCPVDGSSIDPSSGSWATCEMHEWYGVSAMPDGVSCTGNCSCTQSESISYTKATDDVIGIDLVQDPDFPCDLFQYYFGVPRANYEIVKGWAKVLSDCTTLNANSSGIYWISGAECRINSNIQIGSPNAPVLLVAASTLTKFNGGAKIFGVVFQTDVEDANAELQSVGTNTVYGSVIIDGQLGSYQGTFQVVWNENAAEKAPGDGAIGAVIGGWSDFHRDWE